MSIAIPYAGYTASVSPLTDASAIAEYLAQRSDEELQAWMKIAILALRLRSDLVDAEQGDLFYRLADTAQKELQACQLLKSPVFRD